MCEECRCCVAVEGEGCSCGGSNEGRVVRCEVGDETVECVCRVVISAKGRLIDAAQHDSWRWRAVRTVDRLTHGPGECREWKGGLRHVVRVAYAGWMP